MELAYVVLKEIARYYLSSDTPETFRNFHNNEFSYEINRPRKEIYIFPCKINGFPMIVYRFHTETNQIEFPYEIYISPDRFHNESVCNLYIYIYKYF